jgi:hypothetical protein
MIGPKRPEISWEDRTYAHGYGDPDYYCERCSAPGDGSVLAHFVFLKRQIVPDDYDTLHLYMCPACLTELGLFLLNLADSSALG